MIQFTPSLNANGNNSFSFSVSDGLDTISNQTFNIGITAQNDAPTLTDVAAIPYTDTAFVNTFPTITGSLVGSDLDAGTSLIYGITNGIAGNAVGTVVASNAYGTLTLVTGTGAYRFVPNNAAIEPLKASASAPFTMTVSDGSLSASKILTITIAQSGVTESVGDDSLTGTTGNDAFNSLAGNDTINGNAGNDVINGGAGIDGASYTTATAGVTVNLGLITAQNTVSAGSDTITNIENLLGSNYADTLTGNGGNNVLNGGNANDTLSGGNGNDTLNGAAGIDGASYTTATAGVTVNLGLITAQNTVSAGSDTLVSIENLLGSNYADMLTGNGGNNILNGGNANDTLSGGNGSDSLTGGFGKDSYLLQESVVATDTVKIAVGNSVVTNFDIASNFKLGTGTVNTNGVDKLDLASTLASLPVAANIAKFDGIDAGIIHSHRINSGMISFDDINSYTTPLTVTPTNLTAVLSYLQKNIAGEDTVAFISAGNTFVFQDGGIATDTLVELLGVTAQSINTTGLAAASVWIA